MYAINMFNEKFFGYSFEADAIEQYGLYWDGWFTSVISCIKDKTYQRALMNNGREHYLYNPNWKKMNNGALHSYESFFVEISQNSTNLDLSITKNRYYQGGTFIDFLKEIQALKNKHNSFETLNRLAEEIDSFKSTVSDIQVYNINFVHPFAFIKPIQIIENENFI